MKDDEYDSDYWFYDMVTEIPSYVKELGPRKISNYLCNHYYRVWPNWKKTQSPHAHHVMRAVKLLREYAVMKENTLKNDNVLEFKIREGKGSEPPIGNWLHEMKNGTRFLASRKAMNDSRLHDFIVASDPKTMDAVMLGENHGVGGEFYFVDPIKFVRDYEFYMTLEVVEIQDGNSNKVPEGTVASDDRSEVVTEVHDKE